MKTKTKALVLFLFLSAGVMFASNTQVGGIWYNFDGSRKTAEVTYKGNTSNSYSNEYSGDIVIPESVVYSGTTYTVISIGGWAFEGCKIASIDIPNTITSIGKNAFSNTGLKAVLLPDSISSIGSNAFFNCSLKTINIPKNLRVISDYTFDDCPITSVTIPENVIKIGKQAFSGCKTAIFEGMTPPSLGEDAFARVTGTSLYVPCGRMDAYKNSSGWSNYRSYVKYADVHITNVLFENGVAEQCQIECTDTIIITAKPNYGYHFTRWSDGNTENPRTVLEPQLNSIVPEFSVDRNGYCGEHDTLQWDYNAETKTLSINGIGKLIENYYYGIEAPIETQHLIIGEDVTEIGDSAFFEMASVQSITIGKNVTSIGSYAFAGLNDRKFNKLNLPSGLLTIGMSAFEGCAYLESIDFGKELESIGEKAFFGCTRVLSMICLAQFTPNVGSYGLTSISSQAELYVHKDCIQKYLIDSNWSRFMIKEYEEQEVSIDNVFESVTPKKIMINGHFFIIRRDKVYTLQGKEVK